MKFLLLFLIPSFLLSQNAEIEGLVQTVVKDEIPSDFEYFNLVDSSFVITPRSLWFKSEIEEIIRDYEITDLTSDDFLKNRKDTTLNWNDFQIDNARIQSFNEVPKMHFGYRSSILLPYSTSDDELDSLNQNKKPNELYIRVKKHWSQRKLNKKIKIAWINYFNTFKTEDSEYYSFSTPLFNSSENYALFGIKRSQGGAYYLYKKENGKWIQITGFLRWAY